MDKAGLGFHLSVWAATPRVEGPLFKLLTSGESCIFAYFGPGRMGDCYRCGVPRICALWYVYIPRARRGACLAHENCADLK